MVSPTRRRLLQAATAVAAGLAGCSGFAGEESSSTRSVSESGTTLPDGTSEPDPDTFLVRADTDLPPLRVVEQDAEPTEPKPREQRSRRIRSEVIDSESRAEQLEVAEAIDGASVSSFVSETEFETETLYLDTKLIEECFRLGLCTISWSADEVQTSYARPLRSYDEPCDADEQVYESRLIRIPAAVDADEVNSYGSGVSGRGSCEPRRAAVTEANSEGGKPTGTPMPASDGGGN